MSCAGAALQGKRIAEAPRLCKARFRFGEPNRKRPCGGRSGRHEARTECPVKAKEFFAAVPEWTDYRASFKGLSIDDM